MTGPVLRSNSALLDELRYEVRQRPRRRLHVHPDAAMWIAVSVGNTGLDRHVVVIPDAAVREVGRGWVETFTAAEWAALQSLVGSRVAVEDAGVGRLSGLLVSLTDVEAVLDVAEDDRRYLAWSSITAVGS